MKPEEIHIYDISRLIMGGVPAGFIWEVVFRVLFVFILLLVCMRLMGRRMASTMTRNELAAMSSLAAAIGVPIQTPDKGLLPAIIIAIIVVVFQRLISIMVIKNKKLETDTSILIENGCLNLEELKKVGLSRERVFSQLRAASIANLGKVQRLYLESSGKFAVLEQPKSKPGLPIIPDWDKDFIKDEPSPESLYACGSCGNLSEGQHSTDRECRKCGQRQWKRAVEC